MVFVEFKLAICNFSVIANDFAIMRVKNQANLLMDVVITSELSKFVTKLHSTFGFDISFGIWIQASFPIMF